MTALLNPRTWVAVVLAALLGLLAWQTMRLAAAEKATAEARTDLANFKAAAAETTAVALRAQLKRHEQITTDQRKALDAASTESLAAQADSAGARAAADGLRAQVARFAAAARAALQRADAAERGAAGADPIGVLADVLGRADARAGQLAEIADRARISGRLCERSYDALTVEAQGSQGTFVGTSSPSR